MKRGFVLGCLVVLFAVSLASAQDRWQLDFTPVKMDRALVTIGETTTPYWYLIYKVNNSTDDTLTLDLTLKAVSDVGKKTYVEWFSPAAEKLIEAKEGRDFKNVQDLRGLELDSGDTVEAVALFRNVHESTDLLKIHIFGLWDSVYTDLGKVINEDNVLVLHYFRPGDEYFPQFDRFFFKKKEWIVLNRQEKAGP